MTECVGDLIETLPVRPDLAIGHSLGGVLLLEAAAQLRPGRVVYEDPAWSLLANREQLVAEYEARKLWSVENIAQVYPRWTEEEVRSRHEGLALWDAATARIFILAGLDYTPTGPPLQPSLLVLPKGSPFVPAETAEGLRALGWDVRTIPGTGHYVHVDDRPAFVTCVLDWLHDRQEDGAFLGSA